MKIFLEGDPTELQQFLAGPKIENIEGHVPEWQTRLNEIICLLIDNNTKVVLQTTAEAVDITIHADDPDLNVPRFNLHATYYHSPDVEGEPDDDTGDEIKPVSNTDDVFSLFTKHFNNRANEISVESETAEAVHAGILAAMANGGRAVDD